MVILTNVSVAFDVFDMFQMVAFIWLLMLGKMARQSSQPFILRMYLSGDRDSAKFAHNIYIENIINSKFYCLTQQNTLFSIYFHFYIHVFVIKFNIRLISLFPLSSILLLLTKFEMNDLRLLFQADKDRKIINLQFKQINNLQIMIPILSKFQNLQSLSLNGNRLQTLPTDLSPLQKLNQLDISNNLFRDISDVIPSLKTLPRLTHLLFSFKNDDEENLLKKQLPKLQRLNKKPLNNILLVNKKQKQASTLMKLSQKDLQQIAIIYDDIRQVYKKSKYFVDKQLAEEFDKGVDNIMNELSLKLSGSSGEQEVNSSIVGCRYALIDLCFVKIITYFYHFDKNIASIIERIHDYIAQSFKSMSEILKTGLDRTKAEISQIVVKKEELFKNEIKRLKSMQQTHLNEISALQSKNAQLMDRITKNSKSNVLQTTVNNIISKKNQSKSPNRPINKENQQKQIEMNIKFNKSLTLNQLKQTINDIYISKARHNLICMESGIPMETLETHMYTYLNQKYGLKPMTVQWAMSIVNGIKKYGQEDAEIAAFGKILRNQLEQQFVESFKKIKMNIRQSIKKFKGDDNKAISTHQSQQILLISGYKREAIDLIISRIKREYLNDGYLSAAYLQQLTLQFILRKHCQKLKKISALFKVVDSDDDGLINHDQLFALLQKLQIKSDVQIDQLIQMLDPFKQNSINFSHLVETLYKIPAFKEIFT